MMRTCLVHSGASSSGWVGEGQSLSRSVHQTQLCSVQCSVQCTLSFAPRGVCSAPSWAVCNLLCALLRGLYAIQCAERRCAKQTQLLHKGASSCCTLTPPPLFCTSGNRAILQLFSALWWLTDRPALKLFLSSSHRVCFVNQLPYMLRTYYRRQILRLWI